MNRRSIGPLVVGLLAVLALVVVAATLPAPVPSGSSGTGEGQGGGVGPGSGGGVGTTDGGIDRPGWLGFLVRLLFAFLQLVAAFAVLVFLAVLVAYRERLLAAVLDTLRRLPRQLLLLAVIFAIALLYLVVLFWLVEPGGRPRAAPLPPFPGGGGGSSTQSAPTVPDFLLPLVVGVLLVSAVIVLFSRRRGGDGEAGEDGRDEAVDAEADEAAEAVGDAAGRAADRIEAADAENAVYHAWREMTDELGADRRTTTPRGFAERAVAAGMDERDVETLTRLFEDVRYGDREVTPEVERRALETFRRIEAAYGADDAGTAQSAHARQDGGDRR